MHVSVMSGAEESASGKARSSEMSSEVLTTSEPPVIWQQV